VLGLARELKIYFSVIFMPLSRKKWLKKLINITIKKISTLKFSAIGNVMTKT
jgi:hypothetical protein